MDLLLHFAFLRCLPFSFTQRTQRKRLRCMRLNGKWKPGYVAGKAQLSSVDCSIDISAARQFGTEL